MCDEYLVVVGIANRYREPERATRVRRALYTDLAIVALDDGLANVETQSKSDAGPAQLFDSGHAIEPFPEMNLLLGGRAWPLVANPQPHHIATHTNSDDDFGAIRRIFERIR